MSEIKLGRKRVSVETVDESTTVEGLIANIRAAEEIVKNWGATEIEVEFDHGEYYGSINLNGYRQETEEEAKQREDASERTRLAHIERLKQQIARMGG